MNSLRKSFRGKISVKAKTELRSLSLLSVAVAVNQLINWSSISFRSIQVCATGEYWMTLCRREPLLFITWNLAKLYTQKVYFRQLTVFVVVNLGDDEVTLVLKHRIPLFLLSISHPNAIKTRNLAPNWNSLFQPLFSSNPEYHRQKTPSLIPYSLHFYFKIFFSESYLCTIGLLYFYPVSKKFCNFSLQLNMTKRRYSRFFSALVPEKEESIKLVTN